MCNQIIWFQIILNQIIIYQIISNQIILDQIIWYQVLLSQIIWYQIILYKQCYFFDSYFYHNKQSFHDSHLRVNITLKDAMTAAYFYSTKHPEIFPEISKGNCTLSSTVYHNCTDPPQRNISRSIFIEIKLIADLYLKNIFFLTFLQIFQTFCPCWRWIFFPNINENFFLFISSSPFLTFTLPLTFQCPLFALFFISLYSGGLAAKGAVECLLAAVKNNLPAAFQQGALMESEISK